MWIDSQKVREENEYHEWLMEVFGKSMKGLKKRNNKAKREIGPSDLLHTNEKIRAKAAAIYKYQRSVSK
jgi:hypothetical protein